MAHHLPQTPWVGQGRSWFLLGSLAGAGLSLKPPIRESPGREAVNPGTREVPLPPALLTQLVAEPSPGLSPFHQPSLCPHPWEGQHPVLQPWTSLGRRLRGPLPRSLKWQGWDSSPGLVWSMVPGVSTSPSACPTLEQVLRRVTECVCVDTEPSRQLKGGWGQDPKASLLLYTVSEDTLESQAAGVFWSPHSQRGLGEATDRGTDPLPLQSHLCPLLGHP